MTIRKAVESDIPQLLEMIGLLAAFHDDPSEMTAESLRRDLFGPTPWVTALVADAGAQLLGYALLTPLSPIFSCVTATATTASASI